MKPQLKYTYASFLIILWICLCNPAQARHEHEGKLFSSFRNAHTEEGRLRVCIKAIDQRLIYVGMRVIDLDTFLGSKFARQIPAADAEQAFSTYKLGKAQFAWRLVVMHNRQGVVVGYFLNNLTYKGYSSTEPPKAAVSEIAETFRKSKSLNEKLACTIHAIDTRVIKNGTLKSTLHTIFGDSSEEKEVRQNWYSSSFTFGSSENSWRLICCGDSQSIYHYFLTNSSSNLCI